MIRAGLVTNDIWRSSPDWSQAGAPLIIYDPLQLRNGKHKWSITFFSPTSQTLHGFPLFKRRNEAKFVSWPEMRERSQHCLGPDRHSIFSSQTTGGDWDGWDGNKTPFWHLAGAIGPNIYICTFPVWEVLKETCVKELMWSIDQLLSFPALTREPITGTLYWEARQRRIERKINMETFCEQREKMLNKILDALCCQILQHLWVNNSVFKTVIRRRWWHCIRFFSS